METHFLPASVKNLAAELETLHVQLGGDPGEYVAEPGYAPVCEVGDTDPEMIERLIRLRALSLLGEEDRHLRATLRVFLPSPSECEEFDQHIRGKRMSKVVGEALAWVWSLERQIDSTIEELRRHGFLELDLLPVIEAARDVVTVEPNYYVDDDGDIVDMVTVDGRRFRRDRYVDPDVPTRWWEDIENEQIWQLWAASIGGEIIKG